MSFQAKKDYFGVAAATATSAILKLVSSQEGRTASVAEATDARGDVVARTVYGDYMHPSCDFSLANDWAMSVILGTVNVFTVGSVNHNLCLRSVSIKTANGQAPSVVFSGDEVEADGVTDATVATVTGTLSYYHKAQILMSAFALDGEGCYLNAADYAIEADLTIPDKDGEHIRHDIHGGKVTAQITIVQGGDTVPTITAGTDWVITSPLTVTDPNADYPTYTATLVKVLGSTEASS